MVVPARAKTTFAEYQAMEETNQIVELIDGDILVTSPSDLHQETFTRLFLLLGTLLKNGKLRSAPSGLYFDDMNSFEPDLFWISPQNEHCFLRDDGRYWQGAPDLIVEILSPSTSYRDRGIKYETYERHGVREYWLIDPEARFVEVFSHDGAHFSRLGIFQAGEQFTSPILGAAAVEVAPLFA